MNIARQDNNYDIFTIFLKSLIDFPRILRFRVAFKRFSQKCYNQNSDTLGHSFVKEEETHSVCETVLAVLAQATRPRR